MASCIRLPVNALNHVGNRDRKREISLASTGQMSGGKKEVGDEAGVGTCYVTSLAVTRLVT